MSLYFGLEEEPEDCRGSTESSFRDIPIDELPVVSHDSSDEYIHESALKFSYLSRQRCEDEIAWTHVRDNNIDHLLNASEKMMKHNIDVIFRNQQAETQELEEALFDMQVKVNRARLFKRREDR